VSTHGFDRGRFRVQHARELRRRGHRRLTIPVGRAFDCQLVSHFAVILLSACSACGKLDVNVDLSQRNALTERNQLDLTFETLNIGPQPVSVGLA
jgi:hypothetical protein